MERQLFWLEPAQLDAITAIRADGALEADTAELAKVISGAVKLAGVRIAVSDVRYVQRDDPRTGPATRSMDGIWWLPRGDDRALVGGFAVKELAMTITTEGENESPVAEDVEVLVQATEAIGLQIEGASVVGTGLVEVPGPARVKPVRVIVTRDDRVCRPQDILAPEELRAFGNGGLAVAIVQVTDGEEPVVIKHGV